MSRSEEREEQQEDEEMDLGEESNSATITPDQTDINLMDEAQEYASIFSFFQESYIPLDGWCADPCSLLPTILPPFDPLVQARSMTTDMLMEMLSAILDGDSQKLEPLLQANPQLVNLPVGLPFEAHGGRFFNHPAMQRCVILQHPDQTLYDIASALPSVPVIWVMLTYGAKGSTHPLGTDLALHNAIKNGRTFIVQALLHSGGSNANGLPGTSWKPLLQATFWNVPDIVRILLDRGAAVDDTAPPFIQPFKTALQFALDRRSNEYLNQPVRERCEKIIKMLLDAGANIHVAPAEDPAGLTAFEMFLKPWQSNPMWVAGLTPTVTEIFEAFIRKGADLQTQFCGFRCNASSGSTFEHQVLWHSSPAAARLLVDHAAPTPTANGCNMLHEIVGYCPDAKRHPSETLRDIEVLLQRGANPNWQGKDGSTPLTICVETCPSVDIVDRVKLLLDKGADPEMPDGNRMRPAVLAARGFEEPVLSQVMHILVSKYRGRHSAIDQYSWGIDYFPISSEPSFARVLRYSQQNGDFEINMERMLPKATIPAFRKAVFSVASENHLNYISKRRITNHAREVTLSAQERDEVMAVVRMRQDKGIADYQFDQHFVMSLMASPSVTHLPLPHITNQAFLSSRRHTPPAASASSAAIASSSTTPAIPSSSAPAQTDTFFPADPNTCPIASFLNGSGGAETSASTTPNIPSTMPSSSNIDARADSPSSTASAESGPSWFIPETSSLRFPGLGDGSDADIEKAIQGVRGYLCKSCADGRMMGKEEYTRHEAEHWHTVSCKEVGCRRRFCIAERG